MSLLNVTGLTIRYGDDRLSSMALSCSSNAASPSGSLANRVPENHNRRWLYSDLLPSQPTVSGSIEFDGEELLHASEERLNAIRARRIGMIFQDPMQALNPYLRIGRQLRQIVIRHGLADRADADARVANMLHRVGLPDAERQLSVWPHELSGGMRQRVMIAAALIAEPDLLIADEPTTALDVTVQAQILELLESIRDETALLLISHDLGVVAGHCEHLVVLEKGRQVEAGPTTSVFAAPRHPHTRALMMAAPRIDTPAQLPPTTDNTVLTVEGAEVSYRVDRRQRLCAVVDADLRVHAGETLAIVGESGSGKSSLVRAILGLVPMDDGKIVFTGDAVPRDLQQRSLDLRCKLQLVFQDPIAALNPQMQVQDIVGESLVVHAPAMSASERIAAVTRMLHRVDLDETALTRYPHQLSGGQAQRVALARALILDPKVLVCDEAVAALDGTVRMRVLRLLQDIQSETDLAIVFISHDLAVVRSISHRIAVMYMGHLVEVADNQALFETPRHPYTRALIDAVPAPDPRIAPKQSVLGGEPASMLHPPAGCVFHPRCTHAVELCKTTPPVSQRFDGVRAACHRLEELP